MESNQVTSLPCTESMVLRHGTSSEWISLTILDNQPVPHKFSLERNSPLELHSFNMSVFQTSPHMINMESTSHHQSSHSNLSLRQHLETNSQRISRKTSKANLRPSQLVPPSTKYMPTQAQPHRKFTSVT